MKKLSLLFILPLINLYATSYNLQTLMECKKGNASACNGLGALYTFGYSVKQNSTKAHKFYKKACELKSGDGCYNAAESFIEEKKYQEAIPYFIQGCDLNHTQSCSSIAKLFEYGKGIKLDYKEAKKYHKKACELQEKESCKTYLYLDKNGIS
jgi:hypothetical protein